MCVCARVHVCSHVAVAMSGFRERERGGREREMLKIERKADEREVLREVRGKK